MLQRVSNPIDATACVHCALVLQKQSRLSSLSYYALAEEAYRKQTLWTLRPKLHYFAHVHGRGVAMHIGKPGQVRHTGLLARESFVGKIKAMFQNALYKTIALRACQRYLLCSAAGGRVHLHAKHNI